MNDEINVPTMQVTPLKKICMTIGELPTSYLETMTYYEMLVWFTNYLRDNIIPVVNNNGEATYELQVLFTELQSYVNNYFDNLDVQDEINNKLSAMAESGQLTDIIAQYLGLAGMITFNTVAEMKVAENLVNGSKCCTLGYYSANDGGNALYRIRTVTNDDVIDEKTIIAVYDDLLVAELILDNEMNVECFGAYGDNTHDDSVAIKTAIMNCGVVNFGNKTYLSSTINLTTAKDFVLKGHQSTIRFNRTLWNTDISSVTGSLLTNINIASTTNNIKIDGIKFDGNADQATENINTRDYDFNIISLKNVNSVLIENCEITNSYQGGIFFYGVKNGTIRNNNIHKCGIGGLSSIILQRNAINVSGHYYDNSLQNTVYLQETKIEITNNQIYDVVDEAFAVRGIKELNVLNNNIYNIGQYVIEYFDSNTNNENKLLNVENNNINNTGSIVFNFDNTYAIHGTLKFNVLNNNILGIGAFTTYRTNGYHYITTVKDYMSLLYCIYDSNLMTCNFENNKISGTDATFSNTFIQSKCISNFIGNDFDITTLKNYFFTSTKYTNFKNNYVHASDIQAARYELFRISDSDICNNKFNASFTNALVLGYNLNVNLMNNDITNPEGAGNNYTVVYDNNSSTDGFLMFSNNVIKGVPRTWKKSQDNAIGTGLLIGNYLKDVTVISSSVFTNVSKQANYPISFND